MLKNAIENGTIDKSDTDLQRFGKHFNELSIIKNLKSDSYLPKKCYLLY